MSKNKMKLSLKNGGQHTSAVKLNSYAKFFIIGIWVVVGGLTGSIFVNAMSDENNSQIIASNTLQESNGLSSQSINGVNWNIDSVKTSKGSGPFTAPTGDKFIIINLNLDNSSQYTYNFAPALQTKVIEGSSTYEMWPTVLDNPIVAGPINSGSKVSGEISYLVPENISQATFVFTVFENENYQTQKINF